MHDEIVFECKAEEADWVAAIVKNEMEKAGSFFLKDIPCIAKATVADFWKKEWKMGTGISENVSENKRRKGRSSKRLLVG